MKKTLFLTVCFAVTVLLICSSVTFSQEMKPIKLSDPDLDGGKPLMQVLKDRKTTREFSPEKLHLKVLSNLLWAAFGISRPDSGKRTAPSAVNWQEIDIYVATSDGLYLYAAKEHMLQPLLAEDIRALTGSQAFVKDAPVNLIFVADYTKMGGGTDDQKAILSSADTGFISQNVYLFCASEGLATVVRGLVEKQALAEKMKLRPDQKITLAQSVGYPKK